MVQPETVGPLFISSFDSSTVRAGGKHEYQRSDPNQPWQHTAHNHDDNNNAFHPRRSNSDTKHHKAVTTCQEPARPHANSKKTKPHSSTSAKHNTRSAGSAECPSTTPPKRTRATNHTILTTSTQSANTPNSNSTQQASAQATPAVTDSEATKTHQHQSAHSQDNG